MCCTAKMYNFQFSNADGAANLSSEEYDMSIPLDVQVMEYVLPQFFLIVIVAHGFIQE